MSSSFGTLFRLTTFGESHGTGVGAVVDGCPPKIKLSETGPEQTDDFTKRSGPGRHMVRDSKWQNSGKPDCADSEK